MKIHKERHISFFLIALTLASGLGWFINSYPPGSVWTYGVVFLLVGCSIGFLLQFLFNQIDKSIVGGAGVVIFLILRALQLRHFVYDLLLIACLISIDIMIIKIRRKP